MNSSLDPNMIEKMFAYADSDGSGLITQEIDQKRGGKTCLGRGESMEKGMKRGLIDVCFWIGLS